MNMNPELYEIMNRFINKEVKPSNKILSEHQQQLISLVSLVVQQSAQLLQTQIKEALQVGLQAIQVREAIYQCAPYIGFPKVWEALSVANQVFEMEQIALPLENAATITDDSRFDAGLNAQATIFGDGMRQAAAGGPASMSRSSYYLVTNCFGEYYTREGLDLATREMLTLAILVNLGTEPQMKAHMKGNYNMGKNKAFINDLLYQCLPYTGYPRFLNAMNCLNELTEII